MPNPRLSAILITKNEAHQLTDCLSTLDFCDEIIVVDHGSTDDTAAIAQANGAVVIQTHDWPGFGPQKQRALDRASGEWVLSIDADERVTAELKAEILRMLESSVANGFYIKRRSKFLGKWMRFGGWYPDYVLRLVKKSAAHFDPVPVHEKIIVRGQILKLKNHFLHYSYSSISDVLEKQKRYALLSAGKIRARKGNHISLVAACTRSLWAFFRLYVLQLGALDGRQGFISAIFKAQEVFWKYVAAEFQPQQPET
ncbi:MAG: glycosyltransferase family 2 protein [Burkholderiaceae bacterium]|nr:glycosyltransferase family 2 protein [Burkholderiaceae bacterium]